MDQPITSSPVLSPAPVVPEPPKKKSYTWLLILILFLLASGLSFFAWESYRLKSQLVQVNQPPASVIPLSSPEIDPTANWQMYTSSELGFSFRYPSESSILVDNLVADGSVEFNNFVFFRQKSPYQLDVYVNNLTDKSATTPVNKTIGNFNTTEWIGYYKNAPVHYLSFANNGFIYSFGITPLEEVSKFSQDNSSFLTQILSTFKFVEPSVAQANVDEYSGWETYTNIQYGFELKHPSNFKALTDKENLYGWPKAVVLFYSGGQSYDLPVEVWDSEAEYQEKYKGVTYTRQVFQKNNQFITLVNVNNDPVVDKIIASFKSTD